MPLDKFGQLWATARTAVEREIGESSFQSWIEPMELVDVNQGVASFSVPTEFIGSYVSRNFDDKIIHCLRSLEPSVVRIAFCVRSTAAPTAPKVQPEVAPSDTSKQSRQWRERFTFENFVVGKSNQLAYSAARRVAEAGPLPFNPLFLYGGSGLGKTHLMKAIVCEVEKNHPHLNVMYLDAQEYMIQFIQSIRNKDTLAFKKLFRSADMLIVDDVQFLAGKDTTQEEFFHLFNALIDQGKQIVMSSDKSPGEIERLENRIVSRLQSGLVADVHPTDYELRLGILQSKVERMRMTMPDLQIEHKVLEFIAHRISTNVRALEGALYRIQAHYSLIRRPITMDIARDALIDFVRAADKRVNVEDILRKVTDHYNIRMSDMVGPRRHRSIARPRQIAMYLCKELTSKSYPEIGRAFGGRDHTTVMHGIKQVTKLLETDNDIQQDVKMLMRALEE